MGGTAWLFSRPEWTGVLDFLYIDEAGPVSVATAVAMARSAKNLVLLGDQMQLEQPVQGSHPGDAGLSALQYASKDTAQSERDAPVFHAVVPPDVGLFLGESRRMVTGRLPVHFGEHLRKPSRLVTGLRKTENYLSRQRSAIRNNRIRDCVQRN